MNQQERSERVTNYMGQIFLIEYGHYSFFITHRNSQRVVLNEEKGDSYQTYEEALRAMNKRIEFLKEENEHYGREITLLNYARQ